MRGPARWAMLHAMKTDDLCRIAWLELRGDDDRTWGELPAALQDAVRAAVDSVANRMLKLVLEVGQVLVDPATLASLKKQVEARLEGGRFVHDANHRETKSRARPEAPPSDLAPESSTG